MRRAMVAMLRKGVLQGAGTAGEGLSKGRPRKAATKGRAAPATKGGLQAAPLGGLPVEHISLPMSAAGATDREAQGERRVAPGGCPARWGGPLAPFPGIRAMRNHRMGRRPSVRGRLDRTRASQGLYRALSATVALLRLPNGRCDIWATHRDCGSDSECPTKL